MEGSITAQKVRRNEQTEETNKKKVNKGRERKEE
jgi:hypothetical protein